MHRLAPMTAALLAVLLAACGSLPDAGEAPPAAVSVQTRDDATTLAADRAQEPGGDGTPTAEAVASAEPQADPESGTATAEPVAPTQAERDYAALYGGEVYDPVADPTLPPPAQLPVSYDPWEPFNRRMHRVNDAIDRSVARPLANAYMAAVPRPVRLGVGNFFRNLAQPVTALNSLLQGKPARAGKSLARFTLNATLGIGGIFDPATDAGLPLYYEDFGQTLGVWGWARSRYVELPLFGPRTVRDVLGMFGDAPLSAVRGIEDNQVRVFLQGLQLVDLRTQLFIVDAMREGAVDDYALVRDSWLQRRNYQIFGDDALEGDGSLPDYLRDDANPTVPVDAMPIPTPDGR
jgi:phospholipid-binding lipoprotein MlaA